MTSNTCMTSNGDNLSKSMKAFQTTILSWLYGCFDFHSKVETILPQVEIGDFSEKWRTLSNEWVQIFLIDWEGLVKHGEF